MKKKARQHLVPRVFLKSFCDSRPPAHHPSDKPFEPSVWVLDKELSGEAYRKSPAKLFVEHHPYTLAADDPTDPVIEAWLSRIESAYEGIRRKLLARIDLNRDEWIQLLEFIGVLHARTRDQIDGWQASMSDLERITRMVERSSTGDELYSDSEFNGWDEIGKKSIRDRAQAFVQVMLSGSTFVIVNQTGFPFVSSDKPVALAHLFPAWLRQHMLFPDLIPKGIDENTRTFIAYCALSPNIAIVSSPMLGEPGHIEELIMHGPRQVLSLNWLMLSSATSVLISDRQRPFPKFFEEAVRKSMTSSRLFKQVDTFIMLTTNEATYRIETSDLGIEEDGPFSIFTFRASDMLELHRAAGSEVFLEVHFKTGTTGQSGFVRNARFLQVAIDPNGMSVLEQFHDFT